MHASVIITSCILFLVFKFIKYNFVIVVNLSGVFHSYAMKFQAHVIVLTDLRRWYTSRSGRMTEEDRPNLISNGSFVSM